jgi:hypothetical protein
MREKFFVSDIANNFLRLLLHARDKILRSLIRRQSYPKAGKRNPISLTINREIHHLYLERRPRLAKGLVLCNHHLLHKVTVTKVPTGQGEGLVSSLSVKYNLITRSHLRQGFISVMTKGRG